MALRYRLESHDQRSQQAEEEQLEGTEFLPHDHLEKQNIPLTAMLKYSQMQNISSKFLEIKTGNTCDYYRVILIMFVISCCHFVAKKHFPKTPNKTSALCGGTKIVTLWYRKNKGE